MKALPDGVVTIREACAMLAVSRTTLWRWVRLYEATKGKKGLGPCNTYGRTRRGFPPDVIADAVANGVDGEK